MKHKNCIILIIFFFILTVIAGITEANSRMDYVQRGMTKSEVVTILGIKNYPYGNPRVHDFNTFESWQLCTRWYNKTYHDCSQLTVSKRGVYSLTFKNGKLVNIKKRNR